MRFKVKKDKVYGKVIYRIENKEKQRAWKRLTGRKTMKQEDFELLEELTNEDVEQMIDIESL